MAKRIVAREIAVYDYQIGRCVDLLIENGKKPGDKVRHPYALAEG